MMGTTDSKGRIFAECLHFAMESGKNRCMVELIIDLFMSELQAGYIDWASHCKYMVLVLGPGNGTESS